MPPASRCWNPCPTWEEDARESLVSTLDAIDLSSVQAPEHYQKELKRLQKEHLSALVPGVQKGISSTLIFEGWDAAGRGAIRRLTAGTDARITRVIPISAPSDEELAHHYLWRFWRHIPAPVSSPSMTAPGTAVSWWNAWKN